MSKIEVIGIVLLAIIVEFGGILIGRYLGMSQFASVSVGLIPALLLAFPVVRLYGRFSFTQWMLTILCIVVFAKLVNSMIGL